MTGLSLFEKIWNTHHVTTLEGDRAILVIDKILLHEITGGQALRDIQSSHASVNIDADKVFSVADHSISTDPKRKNYDSKSIGGSQLIQSLEETSKAFNFCYFPPDSIDHGIVHVIAPEQGIAQPGITLICGDSHTCTLGALGTLGWAVGTTEINYALQTGALILQKPKTLQIELNGTVPKNVYSKDIMLHLISEYGADAAREYAVEFTGNTLKSLSVESRMTLCNMVAEMGTRYALIAPDTITETYLKSKIPHEQWMVLKKYWASLYSDNNTVFDKTFKTNVSQLTPYTTWGTSPMHACPISDAIPNPTHYKHKDQQQAAKHALDYMQLLPKTPLNQIPIDVAFIGSCTNARLEDLRIAAKILKGKKIAKSLMHAMCTPGSMKVKEAAEKEGLDKIFKQAGFDWRMPGCSNCGGREGPIWNNLRVISTTNRNFENRQGSSTRTHLASPATVAASAITGKITDPQTLNN